VLAHGSPNSFYQYTHTTANNIQLQETISPGNGTDYPKPGDKLTMHYHGTLASNGSKFDASRDRGRPFQFTIGIGQVIKGWDEGVMQMSLGEKAMLRITSDYGYGARGAGGVIPPNADLNFEVELLAINGKSELPYHTLLLLCFVDIIYCLLMYVCICYS
jgi:FK506-binding protein 1